MRCYYTHHYVLPLPPEHRFPMAKYAGLFARVAEQAPRLGIELVEPPLATVADLERVHDLDYVRRALAGELTATELRRIGFPWSPGMIERSRRSAGATRAALVDALMRPEATAVNLAGGTHHAGPTHGAGYCVFNDAAVAIRAAQADGLLRRALIVDLDVHQGNGSAAIFAGDASVYTFSMHGAKNYPALRSPSDRDVDLPDGCDDASYLDTLAAHLPEVLDRAAPEAVIYLAGADPYAGDRLGRLALSKPGLVERDRYVLRQCARRGLPLVLTMAGGYAESVDDIVDIHFATVAAAAVHARELFRESGARPLAAG